MKKNLTLSISKNLLDKARVLAAMRKTSVNEMVRDFLEAETGAETLQATRSDVWADLFKMSDNYAERRRRRIEAGGIKNRTFDREEFYEEVMRECGLL